MTSRPLPDGEDPRDDLGAFIPGPRLIREALQDGQLRGLRLAVKDLFDVEGTPTGCGNPDWPGARQAADRDAWAVARLREAGARVVGRTVTDEVSLGLLGRNRHQGTPINPLDAKRMPGGSSSGSGVAVAAGLADLGLGSDSGGSIRVPASFLGLWGIRPTHGAIPVEGLMAQAPSFDTTGLLARSGDALRLGMTALLPPDSSTIEGYVLASDAVAACDPSLQAGMAVLLPKLEAVLGPIKAVEIAGVEGLGSWAEVIATVQAAEFGATFAPWLEEADPRLSWGVARALAEALSLNPVVVDAARERRAAIIARVDEVLGDRILIMPTTPCPAPVRHMTLAALSQVDRACVRLLCVAGLTGRPQVSVPMLQADGLHVGLSVIGPRGSDSSLLIRAEDLRRNLASC